MLLQRRLQYPCADEIGVGLRAEALLEVLNYSEYAPIAEKKTDSKGTARLTTGLGSLHISARMCSDGEWFYAETVMNTEKEDNCELCLIPQDKKEMTANQKSG